MRRPVLYLVTLIPAAILVITLIGHRPYSHFVFLRLVVSIAAAILALAAHKQNATAWMWVMIGLLVLFNPLVPLHFGRAVWRVLDVGAAGVFVAAAVGMRATRGATAR
jgi:hypothetical protein